MMGPIEWLETTAPNYQYTVRDIPAVRSHLYDVSLKSRTENKLLHALRSASGYIGSSAPQDFSERNGPTDADRKIWRAVRRKSEKKTYNTILTYRKSLRALILPVVLYGCETWSRTLREERRLRVFENRVLRIIFGPKRDEVTGEWRKRNVEPNDLYSSPNIIRVIELKTMRWAGHVARMGEKCTQGFGGETWGKETTWKTQALIGE